jgi:tryptophan 2,3-dioxygenase
VTQKELLQLALLEEGFTRDQVIAILSALIESNQRYLEWRRRHGSHTETDEGYRVCAACAGTGGGGGSRVRQALRKG